MTIRRSVWQARQGATLLLMAGVAACVSAPPTPVQPPLLSPRAPALPAAAPQQDWRDVPLSPGRWTWRGGAGQTSIAQFGVAGQAAVFALRCDATAHNVVLSRAGSLVVPVATMTVTTSFGPFSLNVGNGGGQPPAIVAQATARDPRLDQMAFSRGRFLVDVASQPRLVLPAWPEVARVIEDCRF